MKYLLILLLAFPCFALEDEDDGVGRIKNGFKLTKYLSFQRIPDGQTTDENESVLHSIELPDPSALMVKVTCEARKSDNSKIEGFEKAVLVSRAGGGAVIQGSIANMFSQPASDYNMTYGVNGNNLEVKVTGAAAETVTWRCVKCVQELQ